MVDLTINVGVFPTFSCLLAIKARDTRRFAKTAFGQLCNTTEKQQEQFEQFWQKKKKERNYITL